MEWWGYALLAAGFGTVAQILAKKLLARIHALEFATELSLYSFVFALPLVFWVEWNFSFAIYALIIANGAIWSMAYLFVNQALRHAELSEIAPLTNLKIVVTLTFAILILADIPTVFDLLGIFLIVFGAYALELKHGESFLAPFSAFTHSKNLITLLAGVTLYGFSAVLIKIILTTVPVITYLFFLYMTLFASYLIIDFFYKKENLVLIKPDLKKYGWELFFAALTLFFVRWLIFVAIEQGSVILASTVLQVSVFFSVIAGGIIFHEKNLLRKLIASTLMILGVIIIIL